MIKEIKVKNYKSLENFTLQLGRVNVLIGENGCGKSNILESIALLSAAISHKVENEFLFSRGIRVTSNAKFMKAAFTKEGTDQEIKIIAVGQNDATAECEIDVDKDSKPGYPKWISKRIYASELLPLEKLMQNEEFIDKNAKLELMEKFLSEQVEPLNIENFLIYSPEVTYLRTFEREDQITPLGIKGEGLFRFLKVLSSYDGKEQLQEIKKGLELISWFTDFHMPDNLSDDERYIQIEDEFIDRDLKYFDQKSCNEGFLFLLFYFCLFTSSETPRFFAVDNIDASLNPKLCSELIKLLAQLAVKYNKQVIVTTHNPAILDGLNLNDDDQRLFVIHRNDLGHTKAKRIVKPKPSENHTPIRLSEAFLRGYLGGLPRNF